MALGEVDGESVVVSGNSDSTVRLWEMLTGHKSEVAAVALGEVGGPKPSDQVAKGQRAAVEPTD